MGRGVMDRAMTILNNQQEIKNGIINIYELENDINDNRLWRENDPLREQGDQELYRDNFNLGSLRLQDNNNEEKDIEQPPDKRIDDIEEFLRQDD